MKKEVSKIRGKVFALVFIFIFLVYILVGLFVNIFGAPELSPYFPDLAPFDATVSLILNRAPLITNITEEIFICEEEQLSSFFNVTDDDGDSLVLSLNPVDPFFLTPLITLPGQIRTDVELFSAGVLKKVDVGFYQEIISAYDGFTPLCCTDTKEVNITVIEINNEPNMSLVGVQTMVWTVGENTTFYHQLIVNDTEDGDQDAGALGFNLSFLNYAKLFNITDNGTMFFDPNASLNFSLVPLPLVLNLSVCVNDTGILSPHARIQEFCGQDGNSTEVCQAFSLTVTNENRAPIITDFNPPVLTLNEAGEEDLYFNLTGRDPDGTIPDIYWYVDNTFVRYINASNFGELNYMFACGVSGTHFVKADMTDGLLNDSVEWNVTVEEVACPSPPPSSSGGGGGSPTCKEKWACSEWNVCQDVSLSLEQGLLSKEDFSDINRNCQLDNFGDSCGFQLRNCFDDNECGTKSDKPEGIRHCYFVENPSCSDGVKNCHGGSCEVLVDCGGVCGKCPSCSDGIKNQGELGVDCGGPCGLQCSQKPGFFIANFQYILIGLILILLIIIIMFLIRIYLSRRKVKEKKVIKAVVSKPVSETSQTVG